MIHPLKPDQHGTGLINIASGKVSKESVINVDNAYEIGMKQMEEFIGSLPKGFHSTITQNVVAMKSDKQSFKIGVLPVYSTVALYARIMCLMSVGRIQDMSDVLKSELAPIPTAMFTETGDMNPAHSKSDLKNALKVEFSARHHQFQAAVIDGNALFYSCDWPDGGTVKDLAES